MMTSFWGLDNIIQGMDPTFDFSPVISIEYEGTKLEILDKEVRLILDPSKTYETNIKLAVLGILNYIILVNDCENLILNNILEINLKTNELIYLKENPSAMILDLISEFKKVTSLKAFW